MCNYVKTAIRIFQTWRVHSIFTDVKLNKKVIKDYQLFMVVGILLAIDLVIMTTWQIADPFYRDTKQIEPLVRVPTMFFSWLRYKIIFLQHHPSLEDVLIVQENEYCQSKSITIFIGIIYAYKGVLLVSNTSEKCAGLTTFRSLNLKLQIFITIVSPRWNKCNDFSLFRYLAHF